ncbi:MAG: TetR/AcrR family transcriptional regulator [Dehalococcoidia bacterium]
MSRLGERYLEARRADILDAARRVLVERGYAATTMQDIASAAGLSAGSIYNYFESKAVLLAAVATECCLADRLMFAEHEARAASPTLALMALAGHIGEALTAAGARDAAILRLESYLAAARDPQLGSVVAAALTEGREAVTALVAAARERGELAADVDPPAVAMLLHAVVVGLSTLRVPAGDAAEARAAWELMTRLVMTLLARPDERRLPPEGN